MLSFLPPVVKLVLSFLLVVLNTAVAFIFVIPIAFIKLLPIARLRQAVTIFLVWVCDTWHGNNYRLTQLFCDIEWDVQGFEGLSKQRSYLVLANHQSWVDILVLVFQTRQTVPFLRFFLKRQLFWVPMLGLTWWALDYPFMKRYSREYLQKNPHKKGQDILTTRRACERFRHSPVAVMNFAEGTRFSPAKRQAQDSPFQYLLRPKAGGSALVLSCMGEYLHEVLDVTIAYPDNQQPGLVDYLRGEVSKIVVRARRIPVPENVHGRDYDNDPEYRQFMQNWLNELWQQKDQQMAELLGNQQPPAGYTSGLSKDHPSASL